MSVIDKMQFKDTISGDPIVVDIGCDADNISNLTLNKVSDVNIITPSEGQVLKYNGTSGKWENDATLALGETSATAYRGDRGKAAYDHSEIITGNPHGTKYEDLANVTTIIKVLEAGATTLTFTNNSITATSTFNLYSDVFGVVPTDMVQSGTSLTLTYPAQETSVNIKLVVVN